MSRKTRGFTLVEILIVVIILGILAAIVIPQFTNASNDARNNSVASTLQTLRGQIELYKIQHGDQYPSSAAGSLVLLMTNKTDTTGNTLASTVTTGFLGPYVQSFPTNPVVGSAGVTNAATVGYGWVYTCVNNVYGVQAIDTLGAPMSY